MEKGRIIKGTYGYLNRKRMRTILLTILMFASAIGILVIGISISGSKKNLLTIVAMLSLLPACRSFIDVVMLLKAKKYACPEHLYQGATQALKDKDSSFVKYDLYLTAYDHNYPMYMMACKGGSLIGYLGDEKQLEKDVKKHLEDLLKQNALKVGNIKVYYSEGKFIERLTEMANSDHEFSEMDRNVLHLMENISL